MYKPNRLLKQFHNEIRHRSRINVWHDRWYTWAEQGNDFCSFWRVNLLGLLYVGITAVWSSVALLTLIGTVFVGISPLLDTTHAWLDPTSALDGVIIPIIESTVYNVVGFDPQGLMYILAGILLVVAVLSVMCMVTFGIGIQLLPVIIPVVAVIIGIVHFSKDVRSLVGNAVSSTGKAITRTISKKTDKTFIRALWDRVVNKTCPTVDWSDDEHKND